MLIFVVAILIAVMAVLLYGVRSKRTNDKQVLDMCKDGDTQGGLEATNSGITVDTKDDKYSRTELMLAAANGHTKIIDTLLRAGANVNAKDNNGGTALMNAARCGRTETVNALLKAGADIHAKDNFGDTALMVAKNAEIVNALLNAGAYINATDESGRTALMRQQDGSI